MITGLAAASGSAGSKPDSAAHRHAGLEASPGWYYVVDPESSSLVIGRRVNAPIVSKPFVGGTKSMDELGRVVCRMLHHSARESLMALCVSDSEFRDIMWREFPQSRPITGLTWQDGWMSLDQRLISGVLGAVNDFGGDNLAFVKIQSDSVMTYKNFKLHMRTHIVATGDDGRQVSMIWLRTVAERKGRFKIYSTDD